VVDGGEWSAPLSGRFTVKERAPSGHQKGDYVDLRVGLGDCE
jgi:hypothetical protein